MASGWTRYQRRRYREARRKQAALVADRLLGKKKVNPDPLDFKAYDEYMKTSSYSVNYSMNSPRISFIISGIEGV